MKSPIPTSTLPWLLGLLTTISATAAQAGTQPPLPDTLLSDNGRYRLSYQNNPASTHYVPDALIVGAADALDRNGAESQGNPRGYHDGYFDLGFDTPWFTGNASPGDVVFWDCANPVEPDTFDCDNGFATLSQIVMPAPTYRARPESCVRLILGHELFHHVEFGYVNSGGEAGCGGVFGNAVCEGQARAMQDKIYFDLDLDPAANCVASFDGEADGYLKKPDINIWKASYGAALFWNYLMEQYGTINSEPDYGADFITAWWELARDEVADPDVYDITERTIKLFNAKETLVNAYQDFTVANLVKDLSVLAIPAVQRARYTYVDDGPVLGQTNKNKFGKVAVQHTATVPVNGFAPVLTNTQKFGADYARFDLSACGAGRQVKFLAIPPEPIFNPILFQPPVLFPDALISMVLTKGADGQSPARLYKWKGNGVVKNFVQPNFQPYTRAFVIVSGWHSAYPGQLVMSCGPGPMQPVVTLQGGQAQPGPGPAPVGSIRVGLPSGDPGALPIGGLNASDFNVQIGTLNAPIRSAVREGDGYRLHFVHPAPSGPGPFPLSVQVGSQTTTIANAIRYDDPAPEVIVVLDLSASMNLPPPAPLLLPAVQKVREAAARLKSTARFGLIGHFGNGSEPDRDAVVLLPLAPLSAAHRSTLEGVLNTLTASTNAFSAPGDAILTAEDQFNANGGNGPRSVLLIGDGAQGEGVQAAIAIPSLIRSRAALTAVALGSNSDQPFLQSLARGSDGGYHYVPTTSASGLDHDAFALAVDAAQPLQTREHVLLARQVGVPAGATINEPLVLDAQLLDAAGGASFSAQVRSSSGAAPASIRLFRPDGSEVLTGSGVDIITTPRGKVFQLTTAPTGAWQMQIVGGSAAPTGTMDLAVLIGEQRGPSGRIEFSRPDGDETPLDVFQIGEPVEISYLKVKLTDVLISSVVASVERPDGSHTEIPLLPRAGRDAFNPDAPEVYAAVLDLQTLGSATGIADGGAGVAARGSYRVVVQAHYGDAAGGLVQTSTASFAVLASSNDADGDGLPDRYESAHFCLDPASSTIAAAADPDGDGLSNAEERASGSDPCDIDSDDGGEIDGSEVDAGANPLDASDDAIGALTHAEILTQLSGHEAFEPLPALAHSIRFDSNPRFDQIELWRATAETGPYALIATIDADLAQGRSIDAGLVAGQTYCYKLVPRTAGGRTGAVSEVFCSVARSDMTAPTGSIVLNGGAGQSRDAVLVAHIELDNESPIDAQMNLQLPDGSETGWIPFAGSHAIPTASLSRPGIALVGLTLRDAAGNESERYGDDIALIDANAAGNISGSIRGGGIALAGAMVQVQNANMLAPAFSAGNGDFSLIDLPPGMYTLLFSHPGYQDALRSNLTVTGGGVVDAGVVDLQPESPLLFGNGFE